MSDGALPIHPDAAWVPPTNEDEFEELVRSIQKHGLTEKVETVEGMVVDGRTRMHAAIRAGKWNPAIDTKPIDEFLENRKMSVYDYVFIKQTRRNLTAAQKAIIVAKQSKLLSEKVRKQQITPEEKQAKVEQLTSQLKVSKRSVDRASRVNTQGAKEVIKAVEAEEIPLRAAEAIVAKTKDKKEQVKLLKKAKELASVNPEEKPRDIANDVATFEVSITMLYKRVNAIASLPNSGPVNHKQAILGKLNDLMKLVTSWRESIR